jgi:hypothetical protein
MDKTNTNTSTRYRLLFKRNEYEYVFIILIVSKLGRRVYYFNLLATFNREIKSVERSNDFQEAASIESVCSLLQLMHATLSHMRIYLV